MKITPLTFLCALALSLPAWSQTPTVSPSVAATQAPSAPPMASISPTATVSATPDSDDEGDFDTRLEKKLRRHFDITFDGDKDGTHTGSDDMPWIAVPIVLIVFLAIFGTPVMIVGLIMYFGFSKSRALHRTVRMMVEKGQPVPEALLNPPPVVRQRSDLRRGVVWTMIGLGAMIFFGAVNNWEEGIWSLGIIPFLVGLGYLLVWRLDIRHGHESPTKEEASPKV